MHGALVPLHAVCQYKARNNNSSPYEKGQNFGDTLSII